MVQRSRVVGSKPILRGNDQERKLKHRGGRREHPVKKEVTRVRIEIK